MNRHRFILVGAGKQRWRNFKLSAVAVSIEGGLPQLGSVRSAVELQDTYG
jgi:hypothetical protein